MNGKIQKDNNKIISFYRRLVFGSKFKKQNLDKNTVFEYCFENAWIDMASHTYIVNIHDKNINSDVYKNKHKNEIQKLKSNLKSDVKHYFFESNSLIVDNELLHAKILQISSFIHSNNRLDMSIQLTIGQAQKVVNMFYKYLYTFNELDFIKTIDFKECDCPIDNINLTRINKWLLKNKKTLNNELLVFYNDLRNISLTYKYKEKCWSKIDSLEDYCMIQKVIDYIVNKENYSSRLDFDFDWE